MTESLGFQFYEQRLSGLKTTEAAEVAKLTRMGTDAYMADKQAEVAPLIEAHIAKLKEQQKRKVSQACALQAKTALRISANNGGKQRDVL